MSGFINYAFPLLGNNINRLFPGDPLEISFSFRACTLQGIKKAIAVIDSSGGAGKLLTNNTLRNWMCRVSLDFNQLSILYMGDKAAAVRTVMWANVMDNPIARWPLVLIF